MGDAGLRNGRMIGGAVLVTLWENDWLGMVSTPVDYFSDFCRFSRLHYETESVVMLRRGVFISD